MKYRQTRVWSKVLRQMVGPPEHTTTYVTRDWVLCLDVFSYSVVGSGSLLSWFPRRIFHVRLSNTASPTPSHDECTAWLITNSRHSSQSHAKSNFYAVTKHYCANSLCRTLLHGWSLELVDITTCSHWRRAYTGFGFMNGFRSGWQC